MVLKRNKLPYCLMFSSICLLTLTGCPGTGDRVSPEEEAKINIVGENICFWVPDTEQYQLSDFSIYPREALPEQRKYMFGSDFKIIDGNLCLPTKRWSLPQNGQYIARYFLTSRSSNKPFRKVTTGFEILNGEIRPISLDKREVVR